MTDVWDAYLSLSFRRRDAATLLTPPRVVVSPAWSSFVGSHARNPCTPPNRTETRHTESLEETGVIWSYLVAIPNATEIGMGRRRQRGAPRLTRSKAFSHWPVDLKPLCSLAISSTRPRSEIKKTRDGSWCASARTPKQARYALGGRTNNSRLPWRNELLDTHFHRIGTRKSGRSNRKVSRGSRRRQSFSAL